MFSLAANYNHVIRSIFYFLQYFAQTLCGCGLVKSWDSAVGAFWGLLFLNEILPEDCSVHFKLPFVTTVYLVND